MAHSCPEEDVREPRRLEEAARTVVHAQRNWKLVYADDSDGVDFCVQEEGDHVGVMEVTRQTDEDWRRQEAQLHQIDPIPADIEGDWQLDLARHAGPRDVMKNLDRVAARIRRLEEAGVDHYPHHIRAVTEAEDDLADLGVPSGYRRGSDVSGEITLGVAGLQWWMGDEHLLDAISAAIQSNEDKLRPGPGDRHLFLWVEFQALPTFEQLRTGNVPSEAPDLRDAVDVVWVAPADPLEGQTEIPLWTFRDGMWASTTTAIPDELFIQP